MLVVVGRMQNGERWMEEEAKAFWIVQSGRRHSGGRDFLVSGCCLLVGEGWHRAMVFTALYCSHRWNRRPVSNVAGYVACCAAIDENGSIIPRGH